MFRRRKIEQLIAASLYEPLAPREAAWLDAQLARYPEYADEARALRALVSALPVTEIAFSGNLLPIVQAERDHYLEPARARGGLFAGTFAAAAVVLIAGFVGVNVARQPQAPLSGQAAVSPMERALAEAEQLASDHNFGAAGVLRKALAESPADPRAGEAQALLAEVEYNHGERYAEAYEAYADLRAKHWDTWTERPELAQRFALLDDARRDNFAPMYELERAKRNGAFEQMENIVARYPGRMVASAAVDAMREAVGGLDSSSHAFRAAALENVRKRCSNPIAMAQVDVELGQVYWKGLDDGERARPFFCRAQDSGEMMVAQAANEALDVLGDCP